MAEVVHKGDCSKHKTAVEMFNLFKKMIGEILEEEKGTSLVRTNFVKSEASDIPTEPIIENHVILIDSEESPDQTIQDCGAPKTVGGIDYVKKYLENMNMDINKMPRVMTRDVFVFGVSKFPTLGKIVIPLKYRDVEGNMVYRESECHLINHSIGILIGLETQASWGAWLGTERLEMRIRGDKPGVEQTIAGFKQGGHFIIPTFRASKGEKFEVKKPSTGTTDHKIRTLLLDNADDRKQAYEQGLKKMKKYEDKLKKLEQDKGKALSLMGKYEVGTENYENIMSIIKMRSDMMEKVEAQKKSKFEQLEKLRTQLENQ